MVPNMTNITNIRLQVTKSAIQLGCMKAFVLLEKNQCVLSYLLDNSACMHWVFVFLLTQVKQALLRETGLKEEV